MTSSSHNNSLRFPRQFDLGPEACMWTSLKAAWLITAHKATTCIRMRPVSVRQGSWNSRRMGSDIEKSAHDQLNHGLRIGTFLERWRIDTISLREFFFLFELKESEKGCSGGVNPHSFTNTICTRNRYFVTMTLLRGWRCYHSALGQQAWSQKVISVSSNIMQSRYLSPSGEHGAGCKKLTGLHSVGLPTK